MEKIYLADLEALKKEADGIPNTPMMSMAKVLALVLLNMRYENIMVNRDLDQHPYVLVKGFVEDARRFIKMWNEAAFIEKGDAAVLQRAKASMEGGHQSLFQKLWVKFSVEDYKERIDRYSYRLKINGLSDGWLKGFKCIDFGCGHGNFAHALLSGGAAYVYGVDYGKDSVEYAINARDALKVGPAQVDFKVESVYKTSRKDNEFDLAVQNGVFHHLEDEDKAIKEVRRVLKPKGWLWYYTDGSGGISYDLWDASIYTLRNIPQDFVLDTLDKLNLSTGKRYHLGDGLNATYRHTTWKEITSRLSKLGFGNFKRLKGGFPTDFDEDVIVSDKYGAEKFGESDLRILTQKI